MTQHFHTWTTRYLYIHETDVASGMICDCGKLLTQDEVEDYVNEFQKLIKNVEEYFLYGDSGTEEPQGILDAK